MEEPKPSDPEPTKPLEEKKVEPTEEPEDSLIDSTPKTLEPPRPKQESEETILERIKHAGMISMDNMRQLKGIDMC